jgi:hypothetical protein
VTEKQTIIDDGVNDVIVHTYEDVQSVVDANAAERRWNDEQGRFSKKAEFRKKMSIPRNVMMNFCQTTGLDWFNPEDAKVILKYFSSVDWKNLRTVSDKNI